VVAINRFSSDSEEEIAIIRDFACSLGFDAFAVDFWDRGGAGGTDLAEHLVQMIRSDYCEQHNLYDWSLSVEDKIHKVASEIYGAQAIDFTPQAKTALKRIRKWGLEGLPICIAKTQKSLSDNPDLLGRPKDFLVTVRDVLVAAGAGFLIPITGEIMRMPGLPVHPSAEAIDIDNEGHISGLF
jgi:formate--tetrahydrofolate ligase